MTEVLLAQSLLTPLQTLGPAAVVIEDGRILACGPHAQVPIPAAARLHDFGDAILAPGFIDLHVHGGAGHDFMNADAAGIQAITRHLASHGVTSFLATTVAAPWPQILAALDRLHAVSLGIHLEGPFLSSARRGVHPEADLLPPTRDRLDQLCFHARSRLGLITIAPELPGALDFIADAVTRGILVSLGHSAATREQARAGFQAGARHVTHMFNAMNPLHHRDPGLLGEALTNPAVSAEIIADGLHVDPLLVDLFLRLKGPERALLVSDGISATGCPDGRYPLGPLTVELAQGHCLHQGHLAGSVLTLDQAVRNLIRFCACDLATAVRLVTLNPAQRLGLDHKGRLQPGADADIVVLSPQAEVRATFIAGQQVH